VTFIVVRGLVVAVVRRRLVVAMVRRILVFAMVAVMRRRLVFAMVAVMRGRLVFAVVAMVRRRLVFAMVAVVRRMFVFAMVTIWWRRGRVMVGRGLRPFLLLLQLSTFGCGCSEGQKDSANSHCDDCCCGQCVPFHDRHGCVEIDLSAAGANNHW